MIIQDSMDPKGPIILDGNHVYRGISKDREEEVLDIYKLCQENNLFGNFIISTKIAWGKKIENFGLVLEHERIDSLISPAEYSPLMYKDAGNMVLDFMLKLESLGLGLIDGHIYNVNFHRGKFLWTDFGSISVEKDFRWAIHEFISSFLNPLAIISGGGYRRLPFLIGHNHGIPFKETQAYLGMRDVFLYRVNMFILKYLLRMHKQRLCFSLLKKWFGSYKNRHDPLRSSCRNELHETRAMGAINSGNEDSAERSKALDFIQKMNPERVLYLGGNVGVCGDIFKGRIGVNSIVLNFDEEAIDTLYEEVKGSDLSYVTPAVMDILFPTPITPFEDTHSAWSSFCPSSIERFRSDAVVSFTLVHHLVFSRNMKFSSILKQLRLFTKRFLIVGFSHLDHQSVNQRNSNYYEWYTLENFIGEIVKYFNIIDIIKGVGERTPEGEGGSTIMICELRPLS